MHRRELLAGLAGTATAAGVAGRVGAGSTAAQSDGYEPLGVTALEGARDLVTNDDGSIAYVAVDDGVATVDLSDPTSPSVLAERRDLLEDAENGPLRLLWDVWPDGDRLLGVAQANRLGPDDLHAAVLFDVSDPADPQILDHYETQYPIHNACFADGVAYLTANGLRGNPLVLLDASDDDLTEVGRWSLLEDTTRWAELPSALRQLHDVTVQDGVAYLPYWDAGTWLVDVSDPSDPEYLGHTAERDLDELLSLGQVETAMEPQIPPGNAHYAQVDDDGDLLAVGREAWAVSTRDDCRVGGAAGIDLYDVSDPQSITHHAHVEPPASYDETREGPFTTSHNFDLVDGRLHTSWYYGGVKLHDVSDPTDPEELTWWREPSETAFWTARSAVPGEHFVASSAEDAGGFNAGIEGRVYVFPDEAGEQTDPPSLTDAPAEFESEPRCEEFPDGGTSDDGSADDAGDGTDDNGGTDEDESDAVPGFGVGAAAAGLGLSAAWLRSRIGRTSTAATETDRSSTD